MAERRIAAVEETRYGYLSVIESWLSNDLSPPTHPTLFRETEQAETSGPGDHLRREENLDRMVNASKKKIYNIISFIEGITKSET